MMPSIANAKTTIMVFPSKGEEVSFDVEFSNAFRSVIQSFLSDYVETRFLVNGINVP